MARTFGSLTGPQQAALYFGRKRRRSLLGAPRLYRTHRIYDAAGSAIAVATIDTDAIFPVRSGEISFETSILVTTNGGVHAGLVFEFGSATHGCALWVEDDKIGFHAGAAGTADGATATFDYGTEVPPGLLLDIIAAVSVGDGRVRLYGNGRELARAQASGLTFTPAEWCDDEDGSFASAPAGTVVTDVPVASRQAPDGFTVVRPLSAYMFQSPRHFV